MEQHVHSHGSLARRSTGEWIAGGEQTLKAGAARHVWRAFARNALIIVGVLSIVGMLLPSGVVRSVPGQAVPITDTVRWLDPIAPTYDGPSSVHLLTVRSIEMSRLAAWVSGRSMDPFGAFSEQIENPNRNAPEPATVRASIAGQNAAGIDDREQFTGFSVGFRVPGSPVEVADVPFDARVTGVEGSAFASPDAAGQTVVEIAARGERVALTGTMDERPTTWRLPVVPGPTTGSLVLMGLDPEWDVEPRTVELRSGQNWQGSSATLAIALAIVERYGPDGAYAEPIAATGYVNVDGTVQGVDGVAEKVVAAHRRGLRIVVVSRDNEQEARSAAREYGMRVIAVDTVEQAVTELRELR